MYVLYFILQYIERHRERVSQNVMSDVYTSTNERVATIYRTAAGAGSSAVNCTHVDVLICAQVLGRHFALRPRRHVVKQTWNYGCLTF